MKTATPCAARARAIRTLPRSTRGSCCAEAAGASRPRAPHTDALFLGGLACRGLGLLSALGRLARLGLRFLLEAGAQCLHQVDHLGPACRLFCQRDFLALDLLLHRRLDALAHLVL